MLEKVIEEFNKFIANYDKSNSDIAYKYEHSFAVMDLMAELAFRLNLDKEKIELARVIGLLHDIGRFEQIAKTNSFSDKEFDHAEYGADYLFKDNNIRTFFDNDKYDAILEKAIRYHNKLELPSNLSKDEELFCKMIRDTDKIDIYKQYAINSDLKFMASEVNEKALINFKEEKSIDKDMLKTQSDLIILTIAFIFDINYNESFDLLVETDNFDLFLSTIEVSEDSENLWKKIKELAFDKINRGV